MKSLKLLLWNILSIDLEDNSENYLKIQIWVSIKFTPSAKLNVSLNSLLVRQVKSWFLSLCI